MSRSPPPSWASPISSSPRSTATTCPTAAPSQFVKVIEALRRNTPATTIEILTPDFRNKSRSRGREDHRGAARRLQPQSGDGAAALSDDPARRALLRLAAAAGERQAARSLDLHQIGADGRARRAAARSPPGDGRHALGRRRFPDHGPISPADPAPRQGRGVRHARRRSTLMPRSRGPRASCWSPPRR